MSVKPKGKQGPPQGEKAAQEEGSKLGLTGCWRNVAIMLLIAGAWLGINYVAPPIIMPGAPTATIAPIRGTPPIAATSTPAVQPLRTPTPTPTIRR